MINKLNAVPDMENSRLEWVEPQVRAMDVGETAYQPGHGTDGEARYSDCTYS